MWWSYLNPGRADTRGHPCTHCKWTGWHPTLEHWTLARDGVQGVKEALPAQCSHLPIHTVHSHQPTKCNQQHFLNRGIPLAAGTPFLLVWRDGSVRKLLVPPLHHTQSNKPKFLKSWDITTPRWDNAQSPPVQLIFQLFVETSSCYWLPYPCISLCLSRLGAETLRWNVSDSGDSWTCDMNQVWPQSQLLCWMGCGISLRAAARHVGHLTFGHWFGKHQLFSIPVRKIGDRFVSTLNWGKCTFIFFLISYKLLWSLSQYNKIGKDI